MVMACRSMQRGTEALEQIRALVPAGQLFMMELDLASLASIRSFALDFLHRFERLDVLVNNAGVMAIPYRKTSDGFEMQFGTNHLGHFALTGLLLERLISTPASRIVTVSSALHWPGEINFNDLMGLNSYQPWLAYSQSKLANLLFAYELERRLDASGVSAHSIAAHPGYAATNLQFVGAEMTGSSMGRFMNQVANRLFAQPAWKGALPQLFAAAAPGVQGGSYIGPGGLFGMHGYPRVVRSSPRSYDLQTAKQLWQVSQDLTGVRYLAD